MSRRKAATDGVRSDVVPECFVQALRNQLPGFADEREAVQCSLACLIWRTGTKRYAHREWDGYTSIPHQELYRRFGRNGFDSLNSRLKIFIVTPNWSVARHLTRGYMLTPQVKGILRSYLLSWHGGPTELLDAKGRRVRTPLGGLDSKDSEGVTIKAWKGVTLPNTITLDVARLELQFAKLC